jgi:hypothetical protein
VASLLEPWELGFGTQYAHILEMIPEISAKERSDCKRRIDPGKSIPPPKQKDTN